MPCTGFKFHLQGVVVSITTRISWLDRTPLRKWPPGLYASGSGLWIIHGQGSESMNSIITNISNIQRDAGTELMLDRQVPLVHISLLKMKRRCGQARRVAGKSLETKCARVARRVWSWIHNRNITEEIAEC